MGAPRFGVGPVVKNHCPRGRGALSDPIATTPHPSLRWIGRHRKKECPFCQPKPWGQSWRRGRKSACRHRWARRRSRKGETSWREVKNSKSKSSKPKNGKRDTAVYTLRGSRRRDHLRGEQQRPGAPGQRTRAFRQIGDHAEGNVPDDQKGRPAAGGRKACDLPQEPRREEPAPEQDEAWIGGRT